jgi:hypothetical protein
VRWSGTPPGRIDREVTMNRTRTAALLTAAALTVPVTVAPVAAARDSGAQQRYVASLVLAHRQVSQAAGYTVQGDYVRVLSYWHAHPDWAVNG